MTVLTNTFEVTDSVGIREDLSDIIYDISPTDTPFISNIAKTTSKGTVHEFQQDSLAVVADTPIAEGAETEIPLLAPTTRLKNYTQIASEAARVSGTDLKADNAGRDNEMAYQMAKKGLEIRNQMELTLIGTNKGAVAGAGQGATVQEVAPVLAWLTTNTIAGVGGVNPTAFDDADGRTDGTLESFLEDDIVDGMEAAWLEGAMPSILMCNSTLKKAVTNFTGNATKYKEVDDKTVVNAVDIYVSDFGTLSVVPNRYMRARDVLLMTPDSWGLAVYRDFMSFDLAKTGDSEAKSILTEYTLEARQEKANVLITDRQPA